jgi:hypothetical protein
MKRLWIGAAVAVMLLGVPAAASAKPAPLVCGTDGTLAVSGTVKLTGDLTCDLDPVGDTVIRLAGHTLTGNVDPQDPINVTIRNGTVTGAVGTAIDPTRHVFTITDATIGGRVLLNTGTLVLRRSHVQEVLMSDVDGPSSFTVTNNTMARFNAEADFFGDVTGKVTGNTISGTLELVDVGHVRDRNNTCGGMAC